MSTLRRKTTSNRPIGGNGRVRFRLRNSTRSLIDWLMRQLRPARSKWRTRVVAGRPRLTSSCEYSPLRERVSISSDRSVATSSIFQPASSGVSRAVMMMLYGSWPLEHAPAQIRRVRLDLVFANAGKTFWRSAVKGSESRNHDVSLVVNASTTCFIAAGVRRFDRSATYASTSGWPAARANGTSRDSTRYSLPVSSTIALSARTSSRTKVKAWGLMVTVHLLLLRLSWDCRRSRLRAGARGDGISPREDR